MLFILLQIKINCFIDAKCFDVMTRVNISGGDVKVSYKRTYKWI